MKVTNIDQIVPIFLHLPFAREDPFDVFQVTSHIRIRHSRAHLNGQLICPSFAGSLDEFADKLYRDGQSGYSKFHKMDRLCKFGFLGAELLLSGKDLTTRYDPYAVGVILSNANASLDTDIRHQQQLETGFSSPAIFVYTLPNIVIGEICIRHGIQGENTFFIQSTFDPEAQVAYIDHLLKSEVISACIGGWVECLGEDYDCFLYFVESHPAPNDSLGLTFSTELIHQLFQQHHE